MAKSVGDHVYANVANIGEEVYAGPVSEDDDD